MKKIIIIGGGVSGLTAGIYAQQAGFQSSIYERNALPGGLLAYWQRQSCLLDNCVHWLTGTNSRTMLYQLWENVGVLSKDLPVYQQPYFMQVEHIGETLHLWRDLSRLRTDMLRLSPSEAPMIEEFIHLVTIYQGTVVVANKPIEQYTLWQKIKLLFAMRKIGKVHRKYAKMSIADYAAQFHHPLIQKFLTTYFPVHYNISSLFFVFGMFTSGNADLPAGGSRGMGERMVSRYESLGGKMHTDWEAERIEIKGDRAVGVRFSNGQMVEADYVVIACDLHHAITQLLPKEHWDAYMQEHYVDHPEKYPTYSSVNLFYKVNHLTHMVPEARILDINALEINDKRIPTAFVKHFNYEPSFAPADTTILQVLLTQYDDDSAYWQQLRATDYPAYSAAKKQVADAVAEALEATFPELTDSLTLLDVCTPATNERYCHAYRGAYMSFILTPYNEKNSHNGRVKGLRNVYLAGQWLQAPGGLPNAAVTGKFAIQRLVHDAKP